MSEMEKNLPNIEDEIHSLTSLLNKADTKPPKFEQDKIQQRLSRTKCQHNKMSRKKGLLS